MLFNTILKHNDVGARQVNVFKLIPKPTRLKKQQLFLTRKKKKVLISILIDELSGDEDNTTILYTAVQSTPMCMTITTSSKNSSRKRKIRIKDESRNKNRKVNVGLFRLGYLMKDI